jgi:hypothetical protein
MALTIVRGTPEQRMQDALAQLVQLDDHLDRLADSPLGQITRTMVADARRAILGEAGWPAAQVARLVEQIISGRFGENVPGVVG